MNLPVVTHAARLEDCRSRLRELRSRQARTRDFRDSAKKAVNQNGGPLDTTSEDFRRLERAVNDLQDIEQSIGLVESEEKYVLSLMAGLAGPLHNDSFLQDPHRLEELRLLSVSGEPIGDRMLGTVASRDELVARFEERRQRAMAAAGDVVLPSDAARTTLYGVLPPLTRKIRLLDLIPSGTMEGGAFEILQETYTPGAAETAELSIKPSSTTTLTDMTVKAVTIAVWNRISRQTLADVPGLGASIQALLQWDVERRLEDEILAGNGTGGNMLGILNTSGIGASASATGDSVNSDLVANARRDVLLSNADPNGIVMNPADVTKAIKVKASGSGERLDSDGAFGATPTQMWDLPLIETPAIAAGTALVGDFARGCQLWIREGINARVSDSDQGDFTANAVKMLLEGRFAFACFRPVCFSKVTLSFAN
jgi:HK97 family phage major capsid protein